MLLALNLIDALRSSSGVGSCITTVESTRVGAERVVGSVCELGVGGASAGATAAAFEGFEKHGKHGKHGGDSSVLFVCL